MFWLGLLLTTAYLPGITGAAIPTGWVVLSCVLPWFLWRPVRMHPLHWAGVAFLAYAFTSSLWEVYPTSKWALWQLTIVALSYRLGAVVEDPKRLYQGLAIGCYVSSLVAVFQYFGYSPVYQWSEVTPSGLFYNPAIMGEVAAMVAIALFSVDLRFWIIPLAPAIYLAQSRASGMILIAYGITLLGARIASAVVIAGVCVALFFFSTGDDLRRDIWLAALSGLTPFGHGPGSFRAVYVYYTDGKLYQPEHAHNDYLGLLYEYGLGALPLFWLAFTLLWESTHARAHAIFAAFLTLALFTSPLYSPVLAFLGAFAAGQLARGYGLARGVASVGGPNYLPRFPMKGHEHA